MATLPTRWIAEPRAEEIDEGNEAIFALHHV